MSAVIPADLPALALAINRAHVEAREYASKAVERALQAGDLLIAVKARLAHGEFGPWCAANLPDISERTIRNYMRIARELPRENGNVADLSLRGALRALADEGSEQEASLTPYASQITAPPISDESASWRWFFFMSLILNDMEKTIKCKRHNLLRFCKAVLLIPEDLAEFLLNADVRRVLCEKTLGYRLLKGKEVDGFGDVLAKVEFLIDAAYGEEVPA